MAGLVRRDPRATQSRDIFDRLDTLFDEWAQLLPARMSERMRVPMAMEAEMVLGDYLRVDEYREGDDLVVRADLPLPSAVGDTDVEATYHDGVLEIRVHMPKSETATIPIQTT